MMHWHIIVSVQSAQTGQMYEVSRRMVYHKRDIGPVLPGEVVVPCSDPVCEQDASGRDANSY